MVRPVTPANAMVFDPRRLASLEVAMPDGTSNTVTFAERFQGIARRTEHTGAVAPSTAWAWNTIANGGDCWTSPTFERPRTRVSAI